MFTLIESLVTRGYSVELIDADSDGDFRVVIRHDGDFVDDAYGKTVSEALGAAVAAMIPDRNES